MPKCFAIEDESHAEQVGEFASLDQAWAELERLASVPWHEPPNVAPCTSWQTCGRTYEIIEYETSETPWQVLRRLDALRISAKGVVWGSDSSHHGA